MEDILVILALLWSVLCVILFFKLWGATNNLNKIREIITPQQPANPVLEAGKYIALGNKEKAQEIIDARLDAILTSVLSTPMSRVDFNAWLTLSDLNKWQADVKGKWARSLSESEIFYSALGLTIPERYKNFDFDAYFKAISTTSPYKDIK